MMRPTMTDEEKQALRPFFATKGAWRRHIQRVLEETRLQADFFPPEPESGSWLEVEFISFSKREPIVLDGVDFIRDAEILFCWSREKGKRRLRRYLKQQAVQA